MHAFPPPYAIADALMKGSAKNLIPGAFDPATFHRHPEVLGPCEERIRQRLAEPIEPLLFSDFRRFAEDGTRIHYDRGMGKRRGRLADLAIGVMAGDDPDGSWQRALEDILWEICNEPFWALPAHLWPVRTRGAAAAAFYPPDPANRTYRNTIDLCAAELALCIAEILHVLGDRLAPEVVARCHAEIRERVLDSYLLPADYPHWQTIRNNWAAVCAGSVAATFLYEEPRPERCFNAVTLALAAMQSFLSSFPDDGSCLEGLGYWHYGFGYYVVFSELLREYTGGAIDLLDAPDVRAIAGFPLRAALSATRGVSYSDAGTHWSAPRWIMHRLHRRFPDLAVPECSPAGRGTRFAYALRDFLWSDPDAPSAPLPDAVEYLPSAQWLVVRKGGFAFSAKFGANDVPHNHNDLGTFLLVRNDAEGPMDLGSGEYNHAYFGPGRYGFLVCGSQGHSVPVVAGTLQHDGSDAAARDVRFDERPDGTLVFSGDIAPAYALPALRSLRRTFTVRPGEATVELRDGFELDDMRQATSDKPFDSRPSTLDTQLPTLDSRRSTIERFIGFEKPEILRPGEARFGAFLARFDAALPATVEEHSFSSHGGKPVTAYSLDIVLPADARDFRIDFTPAGNEPA